MKEDGISHHSPDLVLPLSHPLPHVLTFENDWLSTILPSSLATRLHAGVEGRSRHRLYADVVLDDEDALLSSCGVVDGAEVHALPREVGAAAERHAAATGAAASAGAGIR